MDAPTLVRTARAVLGMTQEQLAKELGYPMTGPIVSLIERGKLLPAPETVERLIELLRQHGVTQEGIAG